MLNNAFFKRFGSPIFFNLKKIYFNSKELLDYRKIFYSENNDAFDIVENLYHEAIDGFINFGEI